MAFQNKSWTIYYIGTASTYLNNFRQNNEISFQCVGLLSDSIFISPNITGIRGWGFPQHHLAYVDLYDYGQLFLVE